MSTAIQTTQNKAENKAPVKADIYREFILWTAMPYAEKEKLGLENQGDFCEYYKIDKNTPTRWKQRPDFEDRVDKILKMWATDKTPDVVHSIYRSAVKGNPMSQMLWLQYFKKFNPKAPPEEEKKAMLAPGDIRYMIEQLPEPIKTKHYGYLRELAEDIAYVRSTGGIDDDNWSERPKDAVLVETDHDAQDVPDSKRANEMATRYPECVCSDLVRKAPARHHQGAAWWWQE